MAAAADDELVQLKLTQRLDWCMHRCLGCHVQSEMRRAGGMGQNVFYIECSVAFWIDVAARLQKERGWIPAYWTGCDSLERQIKERFPLVCFHHNVDAVKSKPAAEHADRILPPLDQELLDDLAQCERYALRLMDRMIFEDCLGFADRVRLFHRHVRYWLGMIRHYRPVAVLLPNTPHLIYDYILYELCKREKIATVHFNESAVNGLVYAVTDYVDSSSELQRTYENYLSQPIEPRLTPRTLEYLERFKGDYSKAAPPWAKTTNEEPPSPPPPQVPSAPSREDVAAPVRSPWWRILSPISWVRRLRRRYRKIRCQISLLRILGEIEQGELPPPDEVLECFVRILRMLKELQASGLDRAEQTVAALVEIFNSLQEANLGSTAQAGQVLREFVRFVRMLNDRGRWHPDVLRDAIVCTETLYDGIIECYNTIPRFREPVPQGYQVINGEPPENATYNQVEYWIFRMMAGKKKSRLRDYFESLTLPVDYERPYVYFPLHFQPEKSTCPEGGPFENQFLAVDLLAKSVPEGWRVVVREHPMQFELAYDGEMARNKQLYDDLCQLSNVQLVSMELSPFDLIDHSRAVATVTGTSGWEAVLRGKPAIIFGHAWYKGCDGVFFAPDEKRCREALAAIAAGYRPDERKIKLFLKALEDVGFYGYAGEEWAGWAGVTPEENVNAFVRAIERKIPAIKAA